MISNYVIRWKLKEFKQDEKLLRLFVFKNIANCLKNDFNFKIEDTHDYEDCSSIYKFTNNTDFMLFPNDRTFNFFYTHDIKDLKLNVIYSNKTYFFKLEEKYLHCIPYWMPFMFESKNKDHEQKIVTAKILTTDRPFFKSKEIYW